MPAFRNNAITAGPRKLYLHPTLSEQNLKQMNGN